MAEVRPWCGSMVYTPAAFRAVVQSPELLVTIWVQAGVEAAGRFVAASRICGATSRGLLPELGARLVCLVALGGEDPRGAPRSSVEMLDFAGTGPWRLLPPMRVRRSGSGAVVIGNHIFAAGGEGLDFGALDSLEALECLHWGGCRDCDSVRWEPQPSMKTPRSDCAAAAFGGQVYILGGIDDDGSPLASVERFDPALRAWQSSPPMLGPRRGCAAAAGGGRLFAIAGCDDGGILASVEFFEPGDISRSDTGIWRQAPPLRTRRSFCAAAMLAGSLCVVGGKGATGDSCGPALDSAERLDVHVAVNALGATLGGESCGLNTISGSGWESLPAMLSPRYACAAAAAAGHLCALGGFASMGEGVGDGTSLMATAECLRLGDEVWSALPSMRLRRGVLAVVAVPATFADASACMRGVLAAVARAPSRRKELENLNDSNDVEAAARAALATAAKAVVDTTSSASLSLAPSRSEVANATVQNGEVEEGFEESVLNQDGDEDDVEVNQDGESEQEEGEEEEVNEEEEEAAAEQVEEAQHQMQVQQANEMARSIVIGTEECLEVAEESPPMTRSTAEGFAQEAVELETQASETKRSREEIVRKEPEQQQQKQQQHQR
eukprot:TRINITY_DN27538_c0_g1_i1.p1 TRINITY_DN27538_c0_g1~~TRINITY_DN27538_c0_g1_i1.p1  ORF type:complete len:610 (+),score=135.11 TRINITY_DN27538_c0_g1_i1:185-2014(+)